MATDKMNKKALSTLSAGHLVTDLSQGALPALLPFFKEALSLSYTTSGVIMLVGNLTSSAIQPLFGYYSDKHPRGWLLPLSPLIACLGMSLTGLIPHYWAILICVTLSGLGVASYHPEGFKTAHYFTGQKKATGMSIFAVGGNLGIALGPMWAIGLVTTFGLKGTIGMLIPGIILGAVLLFCFSWLTNPIVSAHTQAISKAKESIPAREKISLILLIGIVILRTWIQLGLATYIPFYYIDYLKGDPVYAGKLVSTFLLAGALGTVIGAPLADKLGYRRFLSGAMALSFPLLVLFYSVSGWSLFVVLAAAGMILVSTFTVTIVMAQTILPNYLGVVSGLMVGFAVGTGGIGVTLLGMIADLWGVPVAMKSILVLPVLGCCMSLLLAYPPKRLLEGPKP